MRSFYCFFSHWFSFFTLFLHLFSFPSLLPFLFLGEEEEKGRRCVGCVMCLVCVSILTGGGQR